MTNRDGLENNNDWATPKWLYDELDSVFNFDFDPCPLYADFDGLVIDWKSSNYINPPYDRVNKPKFINRTFFEWSCNLSKNVLLIPSATGTQQFHNLILPGCDLVAAYSLENLKRVRTKGLLFFEGRIKFAGENTEGVFVDDKVGKHDSMLVVLK